MAPYSRFALVRAEPAKARNPNTRVPRGPIGPPTSTPAWMSVVTESAMFSANVAGWCSALAEE